MRHHFGVTISEARLSRPQDPERLLRPFGCAEVCGEMARLASLGPGTVEELRVGSGEGTGSE